MTLLKNVISLSELLDIRKPVTKDYGKLVSSDEFVISDKKNTTVIKVDEYVKKEAKKNDVRFHDNFVMIDGKFYPIYEEVVYDNYLSYFYDLADKISPYILVNDKTYWIKKDTFGNKYLSKG